MTSTPLRNVSLTIIGRQFSELSDTDGRVIAQWFISNVVAATSDPRVLYYKYHDAFHPPPAHDDEFEYSLCTIINRQSWSRFTTGSKIARAISLTQKHRLPTSFPDILSHPEVAGLMPSFLTEYNSWASDGTIIPITCDPSTIDPSLIGDLMILWDVKYKPDGTFDKYKCRIVFRGDKWINSQHMETYASSADVKGFLVFLSLVATLDWDLSSMDVKTAFLTSKFPDGVRQFVRRPHDVPSFSSYV